MNNKKPYPLCNKTKLHIFMEKDNEDNIDEDNNDEELSIIWTLDCNTK